MITVSHIRNLFQDQSFSKAECVGFSGVAIIWPNLSDSYFPEKAVPFRSLPQLSLQLPACPTGPGTDSRVYAGNCDVPAGKSHIGLNILKSHQLVLKSNCYRGGFSQSGVGKRGMRIPRHLDSLLVVMKKRRSLSMG